MLDAKFISRVKDSNCIDCDELYRPEGTFSCDLMQKVH